MSQSGPGRPFLVIAALAVSGLLPGPAPVDAAELCKTRRGALLVRDTCKTRETTLDVPTLEALGLRGPAGPIGPAGPSGGGLRVVDANGSDVGMVTSLRTYYGQYAQVLREQMLPGGTVPEFIGFSVTPQGVRSSYYGCAGYYGTYYRAPDCSGDALKQCEYGNCSSVDGAFFVPVSVGTDQIGCFTRGATEFERGDFYVQANVGASSIQAVVSQCADREGTLIGPVAPCSPGSTFYCGRCCQLERGVGVAPLHTLDMSTVGTPPFRLSR
jgi:hypothetical protein